MIRSGISFEECFKHKELNENAMSLSEDSHHKREFDRL